LAFEIDPDWAGYIQGSLLDERLRVIEENFLDIDFSLLQEDAPWTVLSNLPYQVTFPILHRLQENRSLLKEGVIMVQEEVAQKIVKQKGRGYGYPSLFFQHYFEWKLMDKIPPTAFHPAPKVFSRLMYFKPHAQVASIPAEEKFWQFIKHCFKQPRRTLRNNLTHTHYFLDNIPAETMLLRAQELSMAQLLIVWDLVRR
jgi:16S rRNA (adenine1518-N6/adenine1519-N6)-dimethyltransferase